MMNRVLIGALAVGAMAASASATNLTLTFVNVSPGETVNVYGAGGWHNGTTAGVFNWQGGYKTFCTELNQNIGGGWTVTYGCVDPSLVPNSDPPGAMGATRAAVLKDLYARYYTTAISGTAVQAAAFQLLVWEITHEAAAIANPTDADTYKGMLSLAGGDFYVGSAPNSLATANTWLGTLGTGGWLDFCDLQGLTSGSYQDQLIVVPIPATAMLAGLGLIGAVAVRRRAAKA